jgi:putative tryptophan/tyrosine transport system substrate-binding protein
MNNRRKLVIVLGAGALTAPFRSFAQPQGKVWQIGLLHIGDDHVPPSYKPLLEGMRALGYEEGHNVHYDFRNAPDESAALEVARTFVREHMDMIVAFDQEACSAAHKATATVPIVMVNAANAIAAGFGKTLARPGGNMTGFAGVPLLPAKELEILHDIAPKLRRVLVLYDSRDAASLAWRGDARKAAKKLGITLIERDAGDPARIDAVFSKLKSGDAEAVMFTSTSVRHRFQKHVLPLASARGMAMVSNRRDMVEAGALFAYTYDFAKVGRLAAGRYVDRVLKGSNPGDLPIEEVTEYQLVVNRGAAKRHGWPLSETVLVRAEYIVD